MTVSLLSRIPNTKKFDETWTRQVLRSICPKLMILRDDVVVGITGDNPDIVLRRLVGLRDQPVQDLLEAMVRIPAAVPRVAGCGQPGFSAYVFYAVIAELQSDRVSGWLSDQSGKDD